MAVHLDTSCAPSASRLAIWQDIVCDVFVELDCKSDRKDFFGSVDHTNFGLLSLTTVNAASQRVFRTPSRIARSKNDFFLFAFGATGQGGVRQAGRETLIRPGEFAFYDTTRTYELSFDDHFTQHIFHVPKSLAQERIGFIEDLVATTFMPQRPINHLVIEFVAGLSRVSNSMEQNLGQQLTAQALDLVLLAVQENFRSDSRKKSDHRSALRFRLKEHIRQQLRDPNLSISRIAASLSISTRYVNVLLEPDGKSFGRYLLEQRLDQCKRDLENPALSHRHVSDICFSWGFNDVSHFGRSFRERFGISPRGARAKSAKASRTPVCMVRSP